MRTKLLLLTALLLAMTAGATAQERGGTEERLATARLQLVEIQSKEAELRIQLEHLDEALKPENIERLMAGVGSTRPEELREHRKRVLTIERDSVLARLKVIEMSRARLEATVAAAEVAMYQPSAPTAPEQFLIAQNTLAIPRTWLLLGSTMLIALLFIVGGVLFRTKNAI